MVCVQALARMQFAPPPKFVMDCAMYLLGKLEAMATGALPPGYLDAAMVARLMTALVSFSFEPPPPLLTMVRASHPPYVALDKLPLRLRLPHRAAAELCRVRRCAR